MGYVSFREGNFLGQVKSFSKHLRLQCVEKFPTNKMEPPQDRPLAMMAWDIGKDGHFSRAVRFSGERETESEKRDDFLGSWRVLEVN